jgi:hypothetical protein
MQDGAAWEDDGGAPVGRRADRRDGANHEYYKKETSAGAKRGSSARASGEEAGGEIGGPQRRRRGLGDGSCRDAGASRRLTGAVEAEVDRQPPPWCSGPDR